MSTWEKIYNIQDDKEYEDAIRKAARKGLMTDQDWWSVSLGSRRLSEEFLTEFNSEWNWRFITSGDREWSEKFLIDNFEYIDWPTVLKNSKVLTPKFISHLRGKFSEKEWGDLIRLGLFTEDMLRYYRKHIPWRVACSCMKLSTSFMREMVDYVDWYELSTKQMLPINFIREFNDKIALILLHNYGKTKLPQKYIFEFFGHPLYENRKDY